MLQLESEKGRVLVACKGGCERGDPLAQEGEVGGSTELLKGAQLILFV